MTVKEILESYDEITIGNQITDKILFFALFEKQFLFIAPSEDDPSSKACIFLYNDEFLDFPHIMLREQKVLEGNELPEGTYRWVCLFEHESIVNSIISYEDKIIDCVDRLIELLSMNIVEREHEFQKEFMFYWNSESVGSENFIVYLNRDDQFSVMDVYFSRENVRLIEYGLTLSDIDYREKEERLWIHHIENDVFYIPIVDNRGILPPHRGYKWNENEIQNIVYGNQIEHISNDTYQKIKSVVPKTQNIILLFGMRSGQTNVTFALRVKCKNGTGHTLLEKLLLDITTVEPLHTERKDYLYLCEQIGNDTGLINKRVLLVGAGSLGSYIAFELAKNGATSIKIYDGDNLEDENILRWAYGGFGKGKNKAVTIRSLLNLLHPQMNVESCNKNLTPQTLVEETSGMDLIIFTIGSSDEQLKFNKALEKAKCTIPVLYVWLEEGGVHSHILFVDYRRQGCFECLYTDLNGGDVNNRSRKNEDNINNEGIIRNGCGGTRAAYGTAILLRTTAALLNLIEDVEMQRIRQNTLIDITPNGVSVSDTKFPQEACKCCGNRSE